MKRETYRSIGAIAGLVLAIALCLMLGLRDMLSLAISGVTGAVAGGITGERIFDSRSSEN